MESVVRTILGSLLQSNMLLGIPHVLKENTTLNEKFSIQSSIGIPTDKYPTVSYFCIGNGGHQMTVGADSIPLTKINQHKATDAALFKHLPFVLRPVTNDLTAAEREDYALRKEETHGTTNYIAYYLKKINMTTVVSELNYKSVNNGVVTSTPYDTTQYNCLNPTPEVISNTGVNVLAGDYVTTEAIVNISFTAKDIVELLNVATIKFSDENYAIISEIGLCSGFEKSIDVTPFGGGGTFSFKEAIGVQIVSFISSMHVAKYTSAGLDKTLSIGCNEPVMNIV